MIKTHGATRNKYNGGRINEYDIWCSMKYRCYNSNCPQYKDWGGRGITVCDRWINSYENFIFDMGMRPSKKHSLDRVENDKGYYKENCRWATKKQQANNCTYNIIFSINGVSKTQKEWAEFLEVHDAAIIYHLKKGRSFQDIHSYYSNKNKYIKWNKAKFLS